ncbi:MAG: translocation/assembly module TamB domain-containing protein [Reyranella sp.]|uniref:translocation/assembly module TamB domain-containing protein n=1 Tax=Reyranella sp. TaxID=1929291 RepID=UPI003D11D1AF
MRWLRLLGKIVVGLVAVLVFAFAALQTAPGQRALASLVSKLATTAEGGLEITGLHGFFPTDLTIERLAYRDRDGPWLTADNLRLRWSLASLLQRRLQIELLSADRIGVPRPPLPDKLADEKKSDGEPLALPLEVDLKDLSIADFHLGAALAGIESRWKITGNAHLPADLVQGRLVLDGTRIDGPAGKLAANIRFDARQKSVDGEVSLNEQRGGIVAVLLERPDIEDLSVRLVARGDARTGQADLNVAAADAVRVTGKLTWEPRGDATNVVARIDSSAPGLPRNPTADALREPIRLDAQATIDDKVVVLSDFKLATAPLTVDASARYDINGDRLEATATIDSNQPGALGPLAGGVAWRGLGLQIKADLGSLATVPQGTVTLTGNADDISLAAINAQLPPLGPVRLQAKFGFADGKATVQSLDFRSTPAVLSGSGSYVLATKVGDLKATVTLPDFAVFSTLAGQPLAGQGTWDLTATSDAKDVSLSWRGTVSDLGATGLPVQLVNASVGLSGTATWQFDQSWTLRDVRVAAGDNAVLSIAGRGQAETADLDLSLDLPKLGWVQPDLAGSARLSATVRQSTSGTDLRLTAEVSDLHHGPLTSRRVSLAASLSRDPAGAIQGTMTTNGDLVDQPLSLEGRFRYDADGLAVPTFEGRWASAVLNVVDLAITRTRRSGRGQLQIARLQDAAPLAGTDLAGSIDLEMTAADIPADAQAAAGLVTVTLQGKGLRSGSTSIASLDLKGTVRDPLNAAVTEATLTASGMGGAADINRVTVTANGNRQGVNVALQAAGARTNADMRGKVEPDGNDILISLSRLEGRHSGIPVALNAPTRVRIAGQRIVLDPTNLRLGGGRLTVRGTIDPTASDLQLELAALPLSLVDAVAPGSGLEGTAQAKVQVRGALAAPRVDATYGVTGLRVRRPEAGLVPPLSIQGSGTISGNQASVDARLSAGGATNLAIKGKAAIPRGTGAPSGSATITGALDIAPFSPLLGTDVRNVTGTLRPNLTVELSGSKINGSGTIDFANGALALPESGLRLSGGEGRLALQGDTVQIQRLNFQTSRNGILSLAGTIRLDAQQGVTPDISVTSRNALLVNRPDLMATVSTNLKVTGSTGTGIDLSGPITIDRAEISVGGQQSASYPTLEVREINKPGGAPPPATTGQAAARPRQPPPGATPIRLALAIQAPRAVFVRGRGLDAEMSGDLKVGGSPAAPAVVGGLTMRRGEFDLLGRRLTFSRGVVTLDNLDRIDPRLDFLASTTVQSTTINVEIKGTARAPVISVTAGGLPPDEAMAMLLFGKPASGLSPFELAQAAQGLAELTGASPESGVLSRLRGGLGLDRLSVGSSGSGANPQMSLEAGRYVAPGIYIGARQGASGNSSRGVVQIDVLDNVKIEGDVGADSNGRVGVKMQWDY